MPSDDRDQQLERALARHLRDATPDLDCPDAEILAAFHERTLALDEMTGWKNHIAGCTRCQETLALMEVTEEVADEQSEASRELPVLQARSPEAPSARNAGTQMMGADTRVDAAVGGSLKKVEPLPARRQAVRWLVPVGAIAAAALVWVGVHERQGVAQKHAAAKEEMQVAENRPAPAPPLPSEGAQPSQTLQETKPASPGVQSYAGAPRKSAPPNLGKRESQAPAMSAAPALDAKRDENKDAAKPREQLQNGPSLKGKQSDQLSASQSTEVTSEAAPVPAMAAPRAAAPPQAQDQVVSGGQVAGLSAPQAQAEMRQKKSADTRDALTSSMNTAIGGDVLLQKVASSDPGVILTPGDQQAWIVGAAGRVRHSADGGKSWTPQNTGVTSDLSTGSAPSPSVVWIVGKSGTILLSVDEGAHWKQLTSPITGDLGGVHAADALHATIWDEGNRKSYSTSDGGATWTRVANE
jgi:hypothetical protein